MMAEVRQERTVEVYESGIGWVRTGLEDLHSGEQFRMFEADGERVYSDEGYSVWEAVAHIQPGEVMANPVK